MAEQRQTQACIAAALQHHRGARLTAARGPTAEEEEERDAPGSQPEVRLSFSSGSRSQETWGHMGRQLTVRLDSFGDVILHHQRIITDRFTTFMSGVLHQNHTKKRRVEVQDEQEEKPADFKETEL